MDRPWRLQGRCFPLERPPLAPQSDPLPDGAIRCRYNLGYRRFGTPECPPVQPMTRKRLCATCVETRDSAILFPVHVVHPRDGIPRLWDVHCEAICPTCSTRWRHNRGGSSAEIVA